MYERMYVCEYVCMNVRMMYVCVCVCVCVCVDVSLYDTLHNFPQSTDLTWRYVDAGLGPIRFGTVQFGRDIVYLSTNFQEKSLLCIRVNKVYAFSFEC